MSKEELIKRIQELPDDVQAFITEDGDYDDIGVVIFTKPKEEKFLEWYFGP